MHRKKSSIIPQILLGASLYLIPLSIPYSLPNGLLRDCATPQCHSPQLHSQSAFFIKSIHMAAFPS